MLKPNLGMGLLEETRLTVKAAFPKGSLYITLRDELGSLFEDEEFAELFPDLGQPAVSPARLALITVMQFLENLTDRQAAEAVRSRIDWKYMLGLELSDPGFHYSVLSEFRLRLVNGGAEQKLLDKLLIRCEELGLLKGKKKQRTDSTHVLAAIRTTSLLELSGETMRRVLDEIAHIAPDWLKEHLKPEWIQRYGRRFDSYHLPKGFVKVRYYGFFSSGSRQRLTAIRQQHGQYPIQVKKTQPDQAQETASASEALHLCPVCGHPMQPGGLILPAKGRAPP